MFRLTLAQMRRSIGRLIAAGIAIAIGAAFVAATLLSSTVMQQATYDSMTAGFAKADLVVTPKQGATITPAAVSSVANDPGVKSSSATGFRELTLSAANSPKTAVVKTIPTVSDDALRTYAFTEGQAPAAANEIAVPQKTAERLGVKIGDEITSASLDITSEDSSTPEDQSFLVPGKVGLESEATAPLAWKLVGISSDPAGAYARYGGVAVVSPEGFTRYNEVTRWVTNETVVNGFTHPRIEALLVTVTPGAAVASTQTALASAIGNDYTVQTRAQMASKTIEGIASGQNILNAFILAFAALALVVASLVISNTFQVLVAQRTRTLALLRCTGATKAQLRGSVVLEATILGVAASVTGIILGAGLVQAALSVAAQMDLAIPLPKTIVFSVAAVIVPLIAGTAVTVLASLVPARAATKVAPLAALRPLETANLRSRAGLVRTIFSVLFVLGGAGLLLLGFMTGKSQVEVGVLLGVAGGAISFVGIVMGTVLWLPPVARGMGFLVSKAGISARLAAANGVRNPRRLAATSTALLIGVTLVTTMTVGAASARATLNEQLASSFPVDAAVSFYSTSHTSADGSSPTTVEMSPAASSLKKVASAQGVSSAVLVTTFDSIRLKDGSDMGLTVTAISPSDAKLVMRDPGVATDIAEGELLLGKKAAWSGLAHDTKLVTGDVVTLNNPYLSALNDSKITGPKVKVVVSDVNDTSAYVSPITAAKLTQVPLDQQIWVKFAPGVKANSGVTAINDVLVKGAHNVYSPAAEREVIEQIIDTILAVLVALLAVAVVIALIGVANTLSLSVLERRRESATLRATGMSKKQLRAMLATEGAFIAGVGAVLGVALGLIYGWVGSLIMLGSIGHVTLSVPWRDIAIVMVISLGAGLLASVIPARGAAKMSPVEALSVD